MGVITFPVNLKTTSGLQILLHSVISLPDATSYDKAFYDFKYTGVFFAVLAVYLLFFIKILVARCLQGSVTHNLVHGLSGLRASFVTRKYVLFYIEILVHVSRCHQGVSPMYWCMITRSMVRLIGDTDCFCSL